MGFKKIKPLEELSEEDRNSASLIGSAVLTITEMASLRLDGQVEESRFWKGEYIRDVVRNRNVPKKADGGLPDAYQEGLARDIDGQRVVSVAFYVV